MGFEETARLLDDSDWVAGPRFGGQEDDGYLTALERSHAGGDGGSGFDSVEGLVAPGEGANLLSLVRVVWRIEIVCLFQCRDMAAVMLVFVV